ncbi:MAG: response regulator, partial [Planctomycetes bacterium]|nr:response regulator [Planctomycetota bacterium]
VLKKYLRRIGYENFLMVTDATQGLDTIRTYGPDLVLLDLMMPRLNGMDLLRRIRFEDALQNLPVIILTAHSSPGNKLEALEAGANEFLAKPVDPYELAPRVRNVLAVKARHDHLVQCARRLEQEVQQRTEELLAAQHAAEVRYLAGKAEIATDVLHNVGNALNSVNVAVSLLGYTLRESKAPSLKRAADLLQEHQRHLARFLTKDERGRLLPSYLADLAKALLQERESSLKEVDLLTKHLEHISAVVATQQKYARPCQVAESVVLADLLRDAEELLSSSFATQAVDVVRDWADVPPVQTDKQKLLQVLVNLLKNAVQSVRQAHDQRGGRVHVRLGYGEPGRICIAIRDNGVGIAPEDMTTIFSHGFTTKDNGSGFGLHSCANIMKELGGTIDAESDGPGCGATFTVTLPTEPYQEQVQEGQNA